MQSAFCFAYINVTQSDFVYIKMSYPLRQFQKSHEKLRNTKCEVFKCKNVMQIVLPFCDGSRFFILKTPRNEKRYAFFYMHANFKTIIKNCVK